MNQPGKRTNGPMNQPGNGRMKQCARERRTARRTLVDGSHRLRFSPRTPRGGRRDPQPHRRQVLDHTARNAHGVGGGGDYGQRELGDIVGRSHLLLRAVPGAIVAFVSLPFRPFVFAHVPVTVTQ